MRLRVFIFCLLWMFLAPASSRAQEESPWMLMSDGVLFGTFNHQGGPRGGDELRSTNWWMGMASRPAGRGRLTLLGMISPTRSPQRRAATGSSSRPVKPTGVSPSSTGSTHTIC